MFWAQAFLLLVVVQGAIKRFVDSGAGRSSRWSLHTTWTPSGAPVAGDEVYIGDASICGKDTVLVDVTTALVASVTVLGCGSNYLLVQNGNVLRADTVTLTGGVLRLQGTGSVVATTKFQQDPQPSRIEGSGTINSPLAELRGTISPGTVYTDCIGCRDNPWVTSTKNANNVGSIAFSGLQTNVIGAEFYVKAFSSASDRVSFVNLGLLALQTTILVDANGVTSFSPIAYQSINVQVAPIIAKRSTYFPWLLPCIIAACPPIAGGSFSCGGSRRCGALPQDPTISPTDPCSTDTSASSLSVTVATSGCASTYVCPNCQHGGTCQASDICSCLTDQNGFSWSGTICDSPVCPLNCNGAASGTCVAGSQFPSCTCNSPWGGLYCNSLSCSPTCQNGGVCMLSSMSSVCNCPSGFDGVDCSTVLAPDTCPSCGTHGVCGGSSSNWTCVCDVNWRGSNCQIPICPGFVDGVVANCLGNGICQTLQGATPTCSCVDGWSGSDCGTRVCPTSYCSNGGSCSISSVTGTDPLCNCTSSWEGTYCTVARSHGASSLVIALAVVLPVVAVVGALVAFGIIFWRRRSNTKLINAVRLKEAEKMAAAAGSVPPSLNTSAQALLVDPVQ